MCIYNRDVNINDRIPKTSMKKKEKNAFLQLNKKKRIKKEMKKIQTKNTCSFTFIQLHINNKYLLKK